MKKLMNCLNFGLLLVFLALSVNIYAQPANDDCANAIDVSSAFDAAFADGCIYQVEGSFSNQNATIDADAANFDETWVSSAGACCACESDLNFGPDVNNPVWFSFTPANTGDYLVFAVADETSPNGCAGQFSTVGDDDTQFWILTGSCGGLTLFDCNEDADGADVFYQAGGSFNFTGGTTYYIVVDGFAGAQGEFCLEIANDTGSCVNCGDGDCFTTFGEDYCSCAADCECDYAEFGFVSYNPSTDNFSLGVGITDTVGICSEFLGYPAGNILLGISNINRIHEPCDGSAPTTIITYDNGSDFIDLFTAGTPSVPSGSPIPSGLGFLVLSPADIAVGNVTVTLCAPDGNGGECCDTQFIDFSTVPFLSNPYCDVTCLAGVYDTELANILTIDACIGGTVDLCPIGSDLSLPCNSDDGSSYVFAWRLTDEFGASPVEILDWTIVGDGSDCVVSVDDLFIDVVGNYEPFDPNQPIPAGSDVWVRGAAFCLNADGSIVDACATLDSVLVTLLDPSDPLCQSIPGCMDPCDPAFDPASTDDTLCQGYSTDCNADCTAGPFGGVWDAATCGCINETTPVNGCTDATACNFDTTANCDDNSCDFGNAACADPCNPVMGCTDAAACNFDPAACVDDSSCMPVPSCNIDICVGDTEIIDPNDPCACIVDQVQVLGCTDAAACNFDTTANCDDSSCDLGNTACADPCNEPDPDDGCDLTTDTFDAATCTVTNTPNCAAGESFNAANCECVVDMVDGCTDPCDPAFDPASTNDVLCQGYSTDCNVDCTAGPFGGVWDPVTCGCVNETTPVNGCTDDTANNYDPAANCDDNSCDFGCIAEAATITGGPFQFCVGDGTPDFVSGITVSGGVGTNTAWVITDDQLNILGLPGMPGEVDFDGAGFGTCLIWYVTFEDIAGAEMGMNAADLTGCFALSNSIEVIREDCSCPATPATITGGPFEFCVNDGTPDFVSGITVSGGTGTNNAWVITDDQLNILGLPGMPGEVDFDGAGFGTCLIWYVTFEDIAGAEMGMNAADLTGCFALSNSIEVVRENCDCEDEISGSILIDESCDVSGIAVLITDAAGNPLGMAIADANGDYTLPGGPYACGEYIATLDAGSIPACYTDAGGDVGPAGFVVNGDGAADGANFSSFQEVPTLSQWGLMSLALLLMIFGALKLATINNVQLNRKKA